jgi:gliding motility-associated-like protein
MRVTIFRRIILLLLLFVPSVVFCQDTTRLSIVEGKIKIEAPYSKPFYAYPVKQKTGSKVSVLGAINIAVSTGSSTCGGSNGYMLVEATGGTPPYIYTITDPYGYSYTQNTGNFRDRPAYTYIVTVTDVDGNMASTPATILNLYPPPRLSISSYQNASGCATNDAKVVLNVTDGTPPFEYSLDGINFQSSNVFDNLYPGVYMFLVRDANGCGGSTNNFIQGTFYPFNCQNALSVSLSQFTCGPNGFIEVKLLNGPNPPYTYSIDGTNFYPTGEFRNLLPGLYVIDIKGANGEMRKLAVNIYINCRILTTSVSVDAACQQNDGQLTFNVTNGTPPYSYSLDGINFQISNVFPNLAAGNYTVTVRDANGTMASERTVVNDKCPQVSVTVTPEGCPRNDGIITASGIKGTPPYQYSIDGGTFQTSNLFTGLASGLYTITIKDALGFTSTTNATVNYGCITVTLTSVNAKCGNANGSITASAGNGTPPYFYSIDGINFSTANTFNGLPAGPHTISVRDGSGKTGTASIILLDLSGPQITTSITESFCNKNDGSISVNGTGGTPPYAFSLNGTSYLSSPVFSQLAPGTYTVWLKDASGCVATTTAIVTNTCPQLSIILTDETCGSGNGVISLSTTGGTPPYTFSIDGNNFQASGQFNNLPAGSYIITIKDANGVKNVVATAIVRNICPVVTLSTSDGLCGTANASITAMGSNGAEPYLFSIDGINFGPSGGFNNLTDGSYTVTIKDAVGLTSTATTIVKNFPAPQLDVMLTNTTCLDNDGTSLLMPTGGSSPFTYSIDGNNWQASASFTGLASGQYNFLVKDNKGCQGIKPGTITLVDNLVLATGTPSAICEGKSVLLSAQGNATAYNWSPATGLNNPAIPSPSASPDMTTKYYLDARLGVCIKKDSVIVTVNPAPVPDAGKDTTICFGQMITLQGSGGQLYQWAPSTYLDDPRKPSPVIRNPTATITYTLTVTDQLGCSSLNPDQVKVTVTPMPKIFAGNDTSIVMNQPFLLQAVDMNNTGFTQFSWSPSAGLNNSSIANPVVTTGVDRTYRVTAKTDQGCTGFDDVTIKVFVGPDIYVPTAFSPNGDGKNDLLKALPVGIRTFKQFAIFNRWGERIFHTVNSSIGWDGSIKGLRPETTTFVWIAEGVDEKGNVIFRRGVVTLVR